MPFDNLLTVVSRYIIKRIVFAVCLALERLQFAPNRSCSQRIEITDRD